MGGAIGDRPSGRTCGKNEMLRRWNNILLKNALDSKFTVWDNFRWTLNATHPDDTGRHVCTPPADNQYIHFNEATRIQFVQQFINYVSLGEDKCRNLRQDDINFPLETNIPN